jgi:hypothetical protein
MKRRTELHVFTPDDLKELCRMAAKLQIVGAVFIGEIGESVVTTLADGSIEVRTPVVECTLEEVS